MKRRELITLVGTAIVPLFLCVVPASTDSLDPYREYHRSVYLAYVNAPAPHDDITAVPRLRISFGGRSYGVVMDTGSVGVVVSANKIPNFHSLQSLGPGQLTYSSSGRIMIGQWVVTPMTILGGNGVRITTAPIPVLAVTRVQCTQRAWRCTPNEAPQRISMMGIGFGRRHDHQEQSGPDKNPFLNVTNLDGSGPVGRACGVRRRWLGRGRQCLRGGTCRSSPGSSSSMTGRFDSTARAMRCSNGI